MWATYRQKRLESYVRRYFKKHPEVKLVAVTGSVGKTSTKAAVATVLSERFRVRLFHGNRGLGFVAALAILGIDYPGDIRGPLAWHRVYAAARKRIRSPSDVDVIVHELNATGPGSLLRYARFITPDITILTALTESNLKAFGSMEALAQEYLSAANISRLALINRDDIDSSYAQYLTSPAIATYGTGGAAEYRYEIQDYDSATGYTGAFVTPESADRLPATVAVYDEFSLRQAVAAMTVGAKMGMTAEEIVRGVANIHPLPGMLNLLAGVEGSRLLDGTANNSPVGSKVGLRALYQIPAPQRIAVLGSMKHLGQLSSEAHRGVGELCDPAQLAWVITVGEEANAVLAPAARARGCQVHECANAIEAGAFLHKVLDPGSVVFFSGPEDDLYVEEALRVVLAHAQDADKLVRQSPEYLAKKAALFSRF